MRRIHFQIAPSDKNFIPFLKPILSGKAHVSLSDKCPSTVTEVIMRAKEKGADCVATSDEALLKLLVPEHKRATIDAYAGSILERQGMEFLIVDPVEQLVKVNYMRFLYDRYFSKLINPSSWLLCPVFSWEMFQPERAEPLFRLFQSALLIACDIETTIGDHSTITCIGFTGVLVDTVHDSYRLITVVVPFDSEYNVCAAKAFLACVPPKVFQNGKYDNAHLLRFNCITYNYSFDTINLFHSWYSELPKDLGVVAAFCLRKFPYWKHEAGDAKSDEDYYRYNAKDSFATALCALALLREMPQWAVANYISEFSTVFPCIMAEMRGIKCDVQQMRRLRSQLEIVHEGELKKLRTMVGNSDYNPGSWQQNQKLFAILGSKDITATGKIARDKVSHRHPLNKRILSAIETYKTNKKLDSTYCEEEKVWHGRIFFALNPHGTDTGRIASKESHFWCGLQIQNIPRDRKDVQIKSEFVADDGFLFGEADYAQNEARGTGYLSGDTALITAVDDETRDFHGTNASRFFGISYEQIVRSYLNELGEWIHDTIDKELRDLSKRTNHGSNYNMGAGVLLDTMGISNVIRAKLLLHLPVSWGLLKVCEHLLACYSAAYPVVKTGWYDKVKADVRAARMLVGPTGWTRLCFGHPEQSKRDLNAYVAHPPQSLAAMALNKAYKNVFFNIQLLYPDDFKLGPQIHDSILFQYRIGHEHLAHLVRDNMVFSIPVTDIFGVTRQLRVPVDLKGNASRWNEVRALKRLSSQSKLSTNLLSSLRKLSLPAS